MKFADVVGQQAIKARLVNTVKENRVSHAQLFLGQEGSGKLPLAIAYAQYINCTNIQDNDSCGVCPSCIKYEKLIHPDLHFIYPTAKVGSIDKPVSKDFITQWRQLVLEMDGYFSIPDWYKAIDIEKKQAIINARDCNNLIVTLGYKSYEADYKVMIIWIVEKIFHAAAPKILKILEEPPPKTLFLLIAEKSEQILSTILSRTQIINIPPIHADDLGQALRKRNIEPVLLNDAIRLSNGNFVQALNVVSSSQDNFIVHNHFVAWMRACYTGKVDGLMKIINEIVRNSRDMQKSILLYSLRMIREAFLVNQKNEELSRMNMKEAGFVEKFHPFVNEKNIQLIYDEINQSIYHIERNASSGIVFLDMSLKVHKYLKM